jgi:hypothetical protein
VQAADIRGMYTPVPSVDSRHLDLNKCQIISNVKYISKTKFDQKDHIKDKRNQNG